MAPMETPALALVYMGTLLHAQRVWSALEGHGLEAVLLNQHSEGMNTYGQAEVAVRAGELASARTLLEELELISPARN